MTLNTTRKSTVTANVAGKTATVVVDPESAHRHHDHRADNVDCCRPAGNIHLRRRHDCEHPRRESELGRWPVAVARRARRLDDRRRIRTWKREPTPFERQRRTRAGSPKRFKRRLPFCRRSRRQFRSRHPTCRRHSTRRSSCACRYPATRRASSATTGSSGLAPAGSDFHDQHPGAGVLEPVGSKVITVTAIQATGPSGDGLASVTVRQ